SAGIENWPRPSPDGLSLLMTQGSDIFIATRSTPTAAWGMPGNTGIAGVAPSLSSDNLTLYYAVTGAGPPQIMQSHRSSVGAPWGMSQAVVLSDGYQFPSPFVSGDEVHALFTGRYLAGQVRIATGTRATSADPFTMTPIFELDLPSFSEATWNAARNE